MACRRYRCALRMWRSKAAARRRWASIPPDCPIIGVRLADLNRRDNVYQRPQPLRSLPDHGRSAGGELPRSRAIDGR